MFPRQASHVASWDQIQEAVVGRSRGEGRQHGYEDARRLLITCKITSQYSVVDYVMDRSVSGMREILSVKLCLSLVYFPHMLLAHSRTIVYVFARLGAPIRLLSPVRLLPGTFRWLGIFVFAC